MNQAWTTRSALWAGKRWDSLSTLISRIIEIVAKRYVDESADIAESIDSTLRSLVQESGYVGKSALQKLVDFVKIFGFTGIVVLIDKVDETEFTQNSAEATTRLIHPLLSHVQLLEVDGFAWQMFLWSQVKPFMEGDKYRVRLDKIASVTIDWDIGFFRKMLDERIKFFSSGRLTFSDLISPDLDILSIMESVVNIAMRSPRELVRLMDTIITEHDIEHSGSVEVVLLNVSSIEAGQDRYVKERINAVYDEKMLNQIYRLGMLKFTNGEVQAKFRVNSQSARNRIKLWEDAGVAKQTGTRAAEGGQGGRSSYEYSIIDSRVARIIKNGLVLPEQDALDENEYLTSLYEVSFHEQYIPDNGDQDTISLPDSD